MNLHLKEFPSLLKETFTEWNKKDPFRQSAVIAYYSIFSLPGLLVLIVTVTGYFFTRDAVTHNIINQISSTFGSNVAKQMESLLTNAGQGKETILGSIIGIATLIIGATGVFIALQKTLNEIWEVKPEEIKEKKNKIVLLLKNRLFSFGLILAIAFLLLISLVLSTALSAVGEWFHTDRSDFMLYIFNIINFIFSLIVISFLFGLMFKILPDTKIKWNQVWMGSLVTGVLFTIGKTALGFYFGKASPESAYGAGGSIVLLLLWVSYSSMILFFGAEFTYSYSKRFFPKEKEIVRDEK
ncbi:YihY/virulence factor BrkB family protein [uncultured Cytophaga sp.]|uniref:YihY/virulence factor BrkB family protein n=1 Tax=uncultured Cytophaga sp. TaxID=160238 RepID=UPI0026162579|nr:YihY/virulence factor BrkB family protein [uncultured Cytophaga sp.]